MMIFDWFSFISFTLRIKWKIDYWRLTLEFFTFRKSTNIVHICCFIKTTFCKVLIDLCEKCFKSIFFEEKKSLFSVRSVFLRVIFVCVCLCSFSIRFQWWKKLLISSNSVYFCGCPCVSCFFPILRKIKCCVLLFFLRVKILPKWMCFFQSSSLNLNKIQCFFVCLFVSFVSFFVRLIQS